MLAVLDNCSLLPDQDTNHFFDAGGNCISEILPVKLTKIHKNET